MLQKGSITNLKLRLTNPAIFHPEHKQPQVFGGNLHRMLDVNNTEKDDEVVDVLITEQDDACDNINVWRQTYTQSSGLSETGLSQVNESCPDEVENLKAEIQRLQKINKKLFEVSSRHIIKCKK